MGAGYISGYGSHNIAADIGRARSFAVAVGGRGGVRGGLVWPSMKVLPLH